MRGLTLDTTMGMWVFIKMGSRVRQDLQAVTRRSDEGQVFLLFSLSLVLFHDINYFYRKQLLLGGATVAIERKHRNGGVDPMELARCATRAASIMPSSPEKWGQTRQQLWDRISSPRALILRHQCTDRTESFRAVLIFINT